MTPSEFDEWVVAYIMYQSAPESERRREDHPLFWAVLKFFDLMSDEPEICWKAILDILRRKPEDEVIGVLSAGPLEDLIKDHGGDFIDRIVLEASRNPDFKHSLGGVWKSGSPEVWARVEAIRGKSW
jgi:hypothetical protein|nr:hypothetical protein [uncultured Undibacterium sp.]